MSIHRRAARRDDNEPTIRKRFAHHGWHTEQLSGPGWPDLLVFATPTVEGGARRITFLVDVKMPDGTVTKPQAKKWDALREKGIPVYAVRTAEDVDALVRGELAAWDPFACPHGARCVHGCGKSARVAIALAPGTGMSGGTKSGARPGQVTPRGKGMRPPENGSDRLKPCGCKRSLGRCEHSGNYTPTRSKPVDATKEAEETFAPPRCHAGRDGDCFWRECPQEANNRANYNMKGCPLATGPREDES